MSVNIRELKQKKAKLVHEARQLVDAAEAAGRVDLNAEEREQYDRIMGDVESLIQRIEREEQLRSLEAGLERRDEGGTRQEPGSNGEQRDLDPRDRPEYREAFTRWLVSGRWPVGETRALQADVNTAGGYLFTPMQFVNDLIKAVDDAVFIRQMATIHTVTEAKSLGAPVLESDPADADWTSELAIGGEDSSMEFGQRELHPQPLGKLIKVSNKLLRMVPDAEALVRDRLAYKFGITEEKAFLIGSGAKEPMGVFTAAPSSGMGITTSRDVSTGNTTTEIRFDGLKEAKYTLKGGYWPDAAWVFHREAVKQIAKLKNNDGQYIWQDSVREGEPDRLLGFPVRMSEYAPNTFSSGQYVGVLGAFRWYWIADALTMSVQRLVELYAGTNQIGFIGRLECDGMPTLEEAFVRVALASS